jgi:hypothetical protein
MTTWRISQVMGSPGDEGVGFAMASVAASWGVGVAEEGARAALIPKKIAVESRIHPINERAIILFMEVSTLIQFWRVPHNQVNLTF